MFFTNKLLSVLKNQNQFIHHHLTLILVFSLIHFFYAPYSDNDEDKKSFETYFQTLYYTIITHFTIGFGDITPKSIELRAATMIHILITFLLFRI